MKLGLDIGSTTLKCVLLDENDNIVFSSYERHFSKIVEATVSLLKKIKKEFPELKKLEMAISGSAGMGLSELAGVSFIQEVYATRNAVNRLNPGTDVVIELGGEDAKILFLTGGIEVRMNGSCAGGTGAFIDQMASLLDLTVPQMNDYAKEAEKEYTIASRCGVFAKSDIQPLVNQGAKKEDISKSIFKAVVNQTIAGLAQGREIEGNILYLGGPLTFISQLRTSFDESLTGKGTAPENSLYYVAMGAAFSKDIKEADIDEVIEKVSNYTNENDYESIDPLFNSDKEYEIFKQRHAENTVDSTDINSYNGDAYLGIDAGSTTIKMVLMDKDNKLLLNSYAPNKGNPVYTVKEFLDNVYENYPGIKIKSSAVTGYGEELIRNAFDVDYGIVETIAHFTSAKLFMPDVDFIIDIGGQDIKCFKIQDGVVDDIFLNEACSSGCGSFLQTFAEALGQNIKDFAKLGLSAKKPVDLGSRCTVFMNSLVKQSQKDGATVEDISAGLSISVVKNALYKVIRSSKEELGEHIVVQGGTFLNDAVLRAFEMEIEKEVIRPAQAGIMGAYGAALYAKENEKEESTLLDKNDLKEFSYTVKVARCGLCNNHCSLTYNRFDNDRFFIGGNRCDKPLGKIEQKEKFNMYKYKLDLLEEYINDKHKGKRGKIGIPFGLNNYELLPFWHAFFKELDFELEVSPISNRALYILGQNTIPSDTICYPAKILHGHIKKLIDEGVQTIFYPCMSYNFDENLGDNNYNCPVVAYYPEVIEANMPEVRNIKFIKDYVGIHREKDFPVKMAEVLGKYFDGISVAEVKKAAAAAYAEDKKYKQKIRDYGDEVIKLARENNQPIIVLAGRPYHLDPEINHGIDELINECGAALVTEDAISYKIDRFTTTVLDQWTYHSRLYAAAKYVGAQPDMNLVQLVSFGCGVDAVTTDEVRKILGDKDKIYTQIKIDEITNLGAVKIRLRSLFATL